MRAEKCAGSCKEKKREGEAPKPDRGCMTGATLGRTVCLTRSARSGWRPRVQAEKAMAGHSICARENHELVGVTRSTTRPSFLMEDLSQWPDGTTSRWLTRMMCVSLQRLQASGESHFFCESKSAAHGRLVRETIKGTRSEEARRAMGKRCRVGRSRFG